MASTIKAQPALWKRVFQPTQEGEERWLRFFRIFLGNILLTGAYAFITVPKIILNGGVTSFSLVLQEWTGMDVAILVDILSVLLIIVSFLFLGKTYFFGALFSSICYMSLFSIFHWTWLGNADARTFWHHRSWQRRSLHFASLPDIISASRLRRQPSALTRSR